MSTDHRREPLRQPDALIRSRILHATGHHRELRSGDLRRFWNGRFVIAFRSCGRKPLADRNSSLNLCSRRAAFSEDPARAAEANHDFRARDVRNRTGRRPVSLRNRLEAKMAFKRPLLAAALGALFAAGSTYAQTGPARRCLAPGENAPAMYDSRCRTGLAMLGRTGQGLAPDTEKRDVDATGSIPLPAHVLDELRRSRTGSL